jgi:hypothetical protein
MMKCVVVIVTLSQHLKAGPVNPRPPSQCCPKPPGDVDHQCKTTYLHGKDLLVVMLVVTIMDITPLMEIQKSPMITKVSDLRNNESGLRKRWQPLRKRNVVYRQSMVDSMTDRIQLVVLNLRVIVARHM